MELVPVWRMCILYPAMLLSSREAVKRLNIVCRDGLCSSQRPPKMQLYVQLWVRYTSLFNTRKLMNGHIAGMAMQLAVFSLLGSITNVTGNLILRIPGTWFLAGLTRFQQMVEAKHDGITQHSLWKIQARRDWYSIKWWFIFIVEL